MSKGGKKMRWISLTNASVSMYVAELVILINPRQVSGGGVEWQYGG